MPDPLTPAQRSALMARVRSKNTSPEKTVRCLLHAAGYRFRLHDRKLPGRPDIVLKRFYAVIFVHGCFWHRHPGCSSATTPRTRAEYWKPKFAKTIERDKRNAQALEDLGWRVITVWECQLRKNIETAFDNILYEIEGEV